MVFSCLYRFCLDSPKHGGSNRLATFDVTNATNDLFGRLRQACVKKQCVGIGKEANVKRGKQPTVCKGINNGGSTKLRTKMITGSRLEMRNGETLSKGKDKMGKAVSVVSLFQRLSCSSLL